MSKKVRMRADNAAFADILERYNIKLSMSEGLNFLNDVIAFIDPDPRYVGKDVILSALDELRAYVENLDEDAELTVKEAMTKVGLDTSIRSSQYAVRQYLKENDLLQYSPSAEETFRKRLTHSKPPVEQAKPPELPEQVH